MVEKKTGNEMVVTKDDVRKYLCPSASEKELFFALGIIKSFNLNPFKREVHVIKYGNSPAEVVVGYEVYLKRAERTGKLDGWNVEISKDGEYAVLTIHRKDWKEPFTWEVPKSEFSKNQATWKSIPTFMLKKVAIAQGFRICFPDELGGLPYTSDEREAYDILDVGPVGKPEVDIPESKDEKEEMEKLKQATESKKAELGIDKEENIEFAPDMPNLEEQKKLILLEIKNFVDSGKVTKQAITSTIKSRYKKSKSSELTLEEATGLLKWVIGK